MAQWAMNAIVLCVLLKVYTVETTIITLIKQSFREGSPISFDIKNVWGHHCGLIYIWLLNKDAVILPRIR